MIPLNLKSPKFFGHNAFELRQPYEERLPILRCAVAHDGQRGVAIYTDRATMGLFDSKQNQMGIVLAYGGDFIYAPNRFAPLVGKERFEVGLYFFSGSIEDAMVVQRTEEFAQPIVVLPATPKSPFKGEELSLVKVEPKSAAVISAVYQTGEGLLIRFWRPYGGKAKFKVSVAGANSLWLTDLHGKPQKQLVKSSATGFQRGQAEIITLLAKER